ncbi:phage baseplate assembly protein V [Micromonospora sp. NPDC002717]|uniref:phage baseplate assembly protein V n=1 Tax=Micromonospora sp. NPDC002717 TaxID=3154424 RepID=UPI0033219502
MTPFYGKYRGRVTANQDPLGRGRVQVSVPAVLGETRHCWAEPCVPYAGRGVGLFAVPPVGAHVWVEFEAGDPDLPILAGCFWAVGEAPVAPANPLVRTWKTEGVSITLSDVPRLGGLTIEVGRPVTTTTMRISCTAAGIELSIGAASVKLTPASVSVNNGALEVK